jgi:hypothetical protein
MRGPCIGLQLFGRNETANDIERLLRVVLTVPFSPKIIWARRGFVRDRSLKAVVERFLRGWRVVGLDARVPNERGGSSV